MMLKQLSRLGILLALSGSAAAEPPQVFEPTVERLQGPPLWISAEAVSEIPYSECTSMQATFDHRGGEAPSSTLSDLDTHSQAIFLGTIASITPGFSYGIPASLYASRLEQLFFQSPSGSLFLSPQLKSDPDLKDATSLDQILGKLR